MPKIDVPQGTLELLILTILNREPMHGHGISQRLSQLTANGFQVNPGSLFPALYKMEQDGKLAAEWRARAEAGNLSAREVVIEVTGRQSFVGSAETVATAINELVQADAADGYIMVPHITPGGLAPLVDQVVPLLQERGVFRANYTGTTLRDHLGLAPLRRAEQTTAARAVAAG